MRVVSVGECMVEMAPAGEPGQYQMAFAGDTLNTAWYLRRLRPKWSVDYLTSVGDDALSEDMTAFLEESGIGVGHITRRTDRTVGLYLISLVAGERSFAYWRGQSAARLLAEDAAVLDRGFAGADYVFLSGITMAVLDGDGREAMLTALAKARAGGVRVVFDPNLRPRLWASDAQMCEVLTQTGQHSDIILPSYEDEAAYFGDATPDDTRDRWLKGGARTVVVKNGGDAISYTHHGTTGVVMPEPVMTIVDTTAAGDSFNAGFLAGLADDMGIEPAIALGCAVAGQVIRGRGALVEISI